MDLDFGAYYPTLERLIAASTAPPPDVALGRVIQACAAVLPHRDWSRLRALDVAGELPTVRAWVNSLLASTPPAGTLQGLYLALCNPVRGFSPASGWTEDSSTTTDLGFAGASRYDRADPVGAWLEQLDYHPERTLGSGVLGTLHEVAYGRRGIGADEEDPTVLGIAAELPVSLAYAAIVGRALAEDPPAVLRAGPDLPIAITMGWSGGDVFFLGEITTAGFVAGRPKRRRSPVSG